MLIVREYQFFAYLNKAGDEVMAGVIPGDITIHLASGEVTYPAGSYEVISLDMKVTFATKEEFESEYTSVETPESLKVHELTPVFIQGEAFVDAANKAGGATPAEINAALQPEVDKLEGIASNPDNPLPVSISVTPTSATVAPGATQQFAATVTGGDKVNPNLGAKWSASVGTVDSTGLYTAPATAPSDGLDTVTAAAKADLNITASAAITIGTAPTP
jgi:hypothetical protein